MDKITKEALFGKAGTLSPEAIERRKEINKKIFKIIAIPISLILLIVLFSDNDPKPKFNDPLKLGIDSVKSLVGNKIPYDKWAVWGHPETLEGTNNKHWIVYLEKANISFVSEKNTDKILFAGFEKNSAIDYLNDKQEKRKSKIEKEFHPYDGSHIELEKLVKKNMNDPESYEHVETRYWDNEDHLIVLMKYRGKNALGSKVLASTKAKVSLDGNILKILN